MVFRVYARELGFEVGGGGRYDALLGRYGRPLPAVGFMLGLDRLALVRERQQAGAADGAVAAEAITAAAPGEALAQARQSRARGRRVRLGGAR
jgi:ATP phosphoribosyltransferase regulatory subunit